MSLDNFKYLYQDNGATKTLVLLHGTGGDEHDLLPLSKKLDLDVNILSLRGNVSENGMNRFFKRLSFGVFDEDNIRQEAEKLRMFISTYLDVHSMDSSDLLFLGYSNGANMIVSLALLHPQTVTTAALMHPMLPLQIEKSDLNQATFAVTYGKKDRMISPTETQTLITVLREKGGEVSVFSHSGGHEVTQDEILFISNFFLQKS